MKHLSKRDNAVSPNSSLQRFLNAYRISFKHAKGWRVQLVTAESVDGRELDHEDRAQAKSALWDYYRAHKSTCRGAQYFVFDLAPELYAIPVSWDIGSEALQGRFRFCPDHEINVNPDDREHDAIVRAILLDGFTRELKSSASGPLGALWRYYKDFCQVPDISQRTDIHFCRKFGIDVVRLEGGVWVAQVKVATQTVDGRNFGEYFARRQAHELADKIEIKRTNRRTRANQLVDVSVLQMKPVAGTKRYESLKLELSDVDRVLEILRDSNKSALLDDTHKLPCKAFAAADLTFVPPSELRLVLDTMITGEEHRETIISPQSRLQATSQIRNVLARTIVLDSAIELSPNPIAVEDFTHGTIAPPAVRIRDARGETVLPAPERITFSELSNRGKERNRSLKRHGFLQQRGLNPLLACPATRFNEERAQNLHAELNALLRQQKFRFSLGGPFLYRDVNDVDKAVEAGEYDSVLLVLPEGKDSPQASNSVHDQAKRLLTVPSQCIQHDNTFSSGAVARFHSQGADAEKYRRRISDHYVNAIWGLAVKCHFVPFAPAESFNYNAHIGIDVGGRDNNKAVICVGYGYSNPRERLFFFANDLPITGAKAEPIPVQPLLDGLLDAFNQIDAKLRPIGRQLNLDRTLFLRDGLLLGDGKKWNERDAFAPLLARAKERGWIKGDPIWSAAEISKSSEGWRPISSSHGTVRNPLVGQWVAPFEDRKKFIVSTTGSPYLSQGTASPVLIKVGDICGQCRARDVLRDIVWEADMCFTKPDMGMKLPWVVYVANEGALQIAKSYEINGMPV